MYMKPHPARSQAHPTIKHSNSAAKYLNMTHVKWDRDDSAPIKELGLQSGVVMPQQTVMVSAAS